MLSVHSFFPSASILVVDEPLFLSKEINTEVDRLWQAEQQSRGKTLFNGNILSAIKISPEQILGRILEYRHLIAQRACPALFEPLQIRSVAVSGLLECADGLVFGKRANSVTQDAGLWELVPSGGIDASKITQGTIDCRAQLLTELQEETGIHRDLVSNVLPFCLIEDNVSHVIEIGISMTSMLSAEMILRAHREKATEEYDELEIIPLEKIEVFIRDKALSLVDTSIMLIRQFNKR